MANDIPGIKTPKFTLKGHCCLARLVDIVDCDTLHVVFTFGDIFYKWNVRVMGVEKNTGIDATEFSFSFFTNQSGLNRKELKDHLERNQTLVSIKCGEFDKYGRLLGDIEYGGISLADELLRQKLAYKYLGGTKLPMKDQRFQFVRSISLQP